MLYGLLEPRLHCYNNGLQLDTKKPILTNHQSVLCSAPGEKLMKFAQEIHHKYRYEKHIEYDNHTC